MYSAVEQRNGLLTAHRVTEVVATIMTLLLDVNPGQVRFECSSPSPLFLQVQFHPSLFTCILTLLLG